MGAREAQRARAARRAAAAGRRARSAGADDGAVRDRTESTGARVVCGARWPTRLPRRAAARRATSARSRAGISLVEDDDPEGWELVREVYPHTGKAAIVGLTGAARRRQVDADRRADQAAPRGRTARSRVLSIDPSSPFTHGALLGDRIRLTEHFLDPGVFIRSMANRGALGGLSEAALQAALLMDAAGKDDVFLETVGVGQAEVDIIDHADTVVLVLMPGSRRLDPGAEGRASWRSPT